MIDKVSKEVGESLVVLQLLRDQLAEIHESINRELIRNLIIPKKLSEIHPGKDLELSTKVHVVNVGTDRDRYVVDELSRLKTAVDSLEHSIDAIKDLYGYNRFDDSQ